MIAKLKRTFGLYTFALLPFFIAISPLAWAFLVGSIINFPFIYLTVSVSLGVGLRFLIDRGLRQIESFNNSIYADLGPVKRVPNWLFFGCIFIATIPLFMVPFTFGYSSMLLLFSVPVAIGVFGIIYSVRATVNTARLVRATGEVQDNVR